ncbi:proline/serine-rich coiled-coil protein 1 isoform X13 [Gallus gallus]|uniref:proline/serine-rich coiled-coil protein 1 isoform X13 n=1 Tax=Gallus gallus TaxID=9031 RepID=UPI001AE8071D|nr:proline/serine-rich coiled-coil protein 1 isoform X13 [Gallus gallus]
METVGGCQESGGTAAMLLRRYCCRRRKRHLGVSGDTPPPRRRPMGIAQGLGAGPIGAAGGSARRHCGAGGRIRTGEALRPPRPDLPGAPSGSRAVRAAVTYGLRRRSLTGCDDGGASREDDDDDEEPPGGANGRWSPLSGAGLEEMVREATRLAAQLQQCQLSPLPPGQGRGSPRSPRRETFVVKDSPVRALLPTVPAAGVPKESLRSHPPASPRGAPSSRGTPSQSGSPRPCPPRGAVARGRSEPLRAGTAAQPKLRSSTATPPTRTPRARTTTTATTAPSSRPPPA